MRTWRYVEAPEDGKIWLDNPAQVSACIEYLPGGSGGAPRRIMVATRSWIDAQFGAQGQTSDHRWALLPTMLLVPEASPAEVEAVIDRAVQSGALDSYAQPV